MKPELHCAECGKPTNNHSLICDACAPEYEGISMYKLTERDLAANRRRYWKHKQDDTERELLVFYTPGKNGGVWL